VWADAQQGRYDELQRVYRVFKSSLLAGYGIADHGHEVAPSPVDYVAHAIVFLAERYRDGQGIFHIASGAQAPKGMFERLNEVAGTSLELMSYYDWVCEMKRLHLRGRSLPIVPLIQSVFSMDEASFNQQQQRARSSSVRVDCTRTLQELESAGIVAPPLDDGLIKRFFESMLARDPELQAAFAESMSRSRMRTVAIG
jgi:hypothetical protein